MATSDRTISKPIVNILTKAQYQGIASPSADEFYLITDDAAVSAGTGISVNSAGGETIVSLNSSYGLTASDITTGTDTTNKLVSAKTIADAIAAGGGAGVYLQKVGYNSPTINQAELVEAYESGYTIIGYDSYESEGIVFSSLYNLTYFEYSGTSVSNMQFGSSASMTYEGSSTGTVITWTWSPDGPQDTNGWSMSSTDITEYRGTSPINVALGEISHANSGVTAQSTQAVYPFKVNATGHITSVGSPVTISDTNVTNTASATTKYYVTGTSSSTTNTGTQYFDTGIYATTTAGQLNATTYLVNEKTRLEYNSTTNSLDFIFI